MKLYKLFLVPLFLSLVLPQTALAGGKAKAVSAPQQYLVGLKMLAKDFEANMKPWNLEQPTGRTPKADDRGCQLFAYENGIFPSATIQVQKSCSGQTLEFKGIPLYEDEIDEARYNNYYRSVITIAQDRVAYLKIFIAKLQKLAPPQGMEGFSKTLVAQTKKLLLANQQIAAIAFVPYYPAEGPNQELARAFQSFTQRFLDVESTLRPMIYVELNNRAMPFPQFMKRTVGIVKD